MPQAARRTAQSRQGIEYVCAMRSMWICRFLSVEPGKNIGQHPQSSLLRFGEALHVLVDGDDVVGVHAAEQGDEHAGQEATQGPDVVLWSGGRRGAGGAARGALDRNVLVLGGQASIISTAAAPLPGGRRERRRTARASSGSAASSSRAGRGTKPTRWRTYSNGASNACAAEMQNSAVGFLCRFSTADIRDLLIPDCRANSALVQLRLFSPSVSQMKN